MIQNKKIVILVLSHNEEPYLKLENIIRETWASKYPDNFKIFYYYGGGNSNKIEDDKIITNSNEGTQNIGYKTIIAYDLLYKNFDFDYIYRTNSSSYLNLDKLSEYLNDKPINNFYNGIIGNYNGINFASGCGYTLSRDLVERVINNKELWNHNYIDDVAIAVLLKSIGISPTYASRIDINNVDNNNNFFINNNLINIDDIKKNFHFRCKTDGDRSGDIEIFKKLNNITKSHRDI